MRGRLPAIVAGGLLAAGLVACGERQEAGESTVATVANVGELPDLQTGRGPDGRPAPVGAAATTPPVARGTTPDDTTTDTTVDDTNPDDTTTETTVDDTNPDDTMPATTTGSTDGAVGEAADGNRILALGDSITAAIGPQYGGQLCDALEAQGWLLGVDAFQGRAIDAGLTVAREEIDVDDWDAAIVNLGSNYRGDPEAYARDLDRILTRLGPMPVVLVTVTEFDDSIAEVNLAIRDLARERDDTWVVEWSEISRDDSLTGSDGLHLSEAGRAELADALADTVGDAPASGPAEPGCELLRDAEADGPGEGGASEGADTGSG